MNFSTIKQELSKKLKNMNEKDFNKFIFELRYTYASLHPNNYMFTKRLLDDIEDEDEDYD